MGLKISEGSFEESEATVQDLIDYGFDLRGCDIDPSNKLVFEHDKSEEIKDLKKRLEDNKDEKGDCNGS